MRETSNKAPVLKSLLRGATHFVLIGLILMGTQQKAQAQYVVVDPANIAQTIYTQMVGAWNQISDAVGKALQTQAQGLMMDTANANNRNAATDVKTAQEIATKNYRDPTYSACHMSTAAAQAGNDSMASHAMAQALAQSQAAKPATPSTNAQDMSNECGLGFAPISTSDPEGAAYKALGCNNSNTKWVRADRTIESLLGQRQLPVPPNLNLSNGLYGVKFSPPIADKYMPFVAALTFCQHITQALAPAPVPDSSGKATASFTVIGYQVNAESAASIGPGACYEALAQRMQFGSETNYPAGTPVNGVKTRHDEQAALCTEDNAAGLLDDDKLATCQQSGRSSLEAAYDLAYRRATGKWHTQVLTKVDANTEQLLISQAISDERAVYTQESQERTYLTEAISGAHSVGSPSVSPLSTLTTANAGQ